MTLRSLRGRHGIVQSMGFPLFAALLVAAAIATLGCLVLIQVLRAWITTHEEFSLAAMRQLTKACQLYFVTNQDFPDDLRHLAFPMAAPPYVEQSYVGDGVTVVRQGYQFTYAHPHPDHPGKRSTFQILADPVPGRVTGKRHFYIDHTMVIRETMEDRHATSLDPRVR